MGLLPTLTAPDAADGGGGNYTPNVAQTRSFLSLCSAESKHAQLNLNL